MNVLVLCHANRWRSPLVHGYLEHLIEMQYKHEPEINIRSAGFKEAGLRAGKPIRDVAVELGFSLEDHRSSVLYTTDLDWANLVIHMGHGNEKRLKSHLTDRGVDLYPRMSKAYCLGEWCTPKRGTIQDFAFLRRRSPEFDAAVRYTIAACDKLMKEVIVPRATKELEDARVASLQNRNGEMNVQPR